MKSSRFCTCYKCPPTLYVFKYSIADNKWEISNNGLLKRMMCISMLPIILRQNHLHSWNIIKFSGGVHGAFAASVLLTCCVFIGSTLIKLISCIAAQFVNEINLDMTSTYFREEQHDKVNSLQDLDEVTSNIYAAGFVTSKTFGFKIWSRAKPIFSGSRGWLSPLPRPQ